MWAYFALRAGWLKINVGTNLGPQIFMYLSALEELNKTSNSSTFLLPFGEMVHMEKKLLHSVTNWWLINEGYRINSVIIQSVRHGNDKIWQNRSLKIYQMSH